MATSYNSGTGEDNCPRASNRLLRSPLARLRPLATLRERRSQKPVLNGFETTFTIALTIK
ncbi:hypothetical protein [Moorena sp. SIO3I6]|uniref:hypothetical protein n=1 Tax=Moorena sp. SIO3I6 TaxID=2607831 RepID=UPI0025CFEAED|nr:hypothetical protein [Moorena sp. SIO3I6]